MRRRRPPTSSILVGVVSAVLFCLGASGQAQAAFTSAPTASTTLATATLAPPTSVTLSAACGTVLLTTPTATLTWTATSSTFATGYTITPIDNGVAQSTVAVSGRATTSATVNITRSSSILTNNQTWAFTIVAAYNSSWTSTSVTPSPASVQCPGLSL